MVNSLSGVSAGGRDSVTVSGGGGGGSLVGDGGGGDSRGGVKVGVGKVDMSVGVTGIAAS